MNDDTNTEINFGNFSVIQIDFMEMTRQCRRIEELGSQIIQNINKINSAVQKLAGLVGCSVSLDISNYASNIQNEIDLISNNMQAQINNYSELNEEIKNELTSLVDKLFTVETNEFGETIYHLKDNFGDIVINENNMTYNDILKSSNNNSNNTQLDFTPTENYNAEKLADAIMFWEIGTPETMIAFGILDSSGQNYIVNRDSDGSLSVGPGLHLDVLGFNPSEYKVGDQMSKEYIDSRYQEILKNCRKYLEDTLAKEEFSDIHFNDAQMDSFTSLIYNSGQGRTEYFLRKYQEAQAQGMSFYDYCGQYWTNGMQALAKRRKGESVLFEKGYDAFAEWHKQENGGADYFHWDD